MADTQVRRQRSLLRSSFSSLKRLGSSKKLSRDVVVHHDSIAEHSSSLSFSPSSPKLNLREDPMTEFAQLSISKRQHYRSQSLSLSAFSATSHSLKHHPSTPKQHTTSRAVSTPSHSPNFSTRTRSSTASSTRSSILEYHYPRNSHGQVIVPYPHYDDTRGAEPSIDYDQFVSRNPPPKNPTRSRVWPNPYPQVPGYPGYGCESEDEAASATGAGYEDDDDEGNYQWGSNSRYF